MATPPLDVDTYLGNTANAIKEIGDLFGFLHKSKKKVHTVEHEIHACPKYSELGSFTS